MRARASALGAGFSGRVHTLPGTATVLLTAGFVAMVGGIGVSTAAAEITQNFQAADSRPLDIAAGAEGDLWYTGAEAPFPCAGGIGLFEPPSDVKRIGVECEGKNEFVGNGINDITLGHEGNLWFTAGGGIGRIEPSATESEDFFLPPVENAIKKGEPIPNIALGGITIGPEHENLWFTDVEDHTNKIARINPTKPSEIKEFTLPAGNELGSGVSAANSDNIAAGPGDTLWFAEPGSHAIGVINTEGILLDKIALKESDDPQSIAAGAEGNMWFTDASTPYAIGRINPAGEVSEFPAPSPPTNIIEGPDGNMWFTQDSSEEAGLGCIIPTGQIELIREPSGGGSPVGLTVNKDSSIWFTESSGDRLARLYPVACGAKAPTITPPNSGGTGTTPNSASTGTGTTPIGGPTPVQPPSLSPPLATVLGLPPAQQCVSKRELLVHVHAPPGQQLLSVKLSLAGKVLRSETFTKGKNHKVPPTLVDLRGLPKGTFTLTIVVKTKAGKTYRATRTYHTCVPGKHKQGKGH
jgi:virginiamycin B lyase